MDWLTPQAILIALAIFGLRVIDMSMDTMRMLFVVRGRKRISWVLGFFQSLVFVIAISAALTEVAKNPLAVLGYGAGFATGNVVGMYIEDRLAIGHIQFTIVSSRRGAEVVNELRKTGYAVTEIPARGKDGTVSLLQVSVLRKDRDIVETVVLETDPDA
ncbi:MAG TPA: DUF5698 domain-containing protein, partial [Polyangia bacterium]